MAFRRAGIPGGTSWQRWHSPVSMPWHLIRGFGDTKGPESPEKYTALDQVADLVGLLAALGEKQVFVVGHDWGGVHAWDLCLMRPDLVKAIVTLSVRFIPRTSSGSGLTFIRRARGEGVYMARYQEKGAAEALVEKKGYESVIKGLILSDYPFQNEDKPEVDDFIKDGPEELPEWFTSEDLRHYVATLKKTGLTAPLNVYRAMERSWEQKAAWTDCGIPNTPAITIIGDQDMVYHFPGMKEFIHGGAFKALVPKLKGTIVLEGAHHHIHQERSETVSADIVKFFGDLNV